MISFETRHKAWGQVYQTGKMMEEDGSALGR